MSGILLKSRQIALIAFGAIIGVGVMMIAIHKPHHSRTDIREQVIPAQKMRLSDSNNLVFATLNLSPEGSIIFQSFDNDSILMDFTQIDGELGRQRSLTIAAPLGATPDNPGSFLAINVGDSVSLFTDHPDRTITTDRTMAYPSRAAWLKNLYARYLSREPHETLEETIPAEDVRLEDSHEKLFAVCGLGYGGDPTISFVKADGTLLATFYLMPFENYTSHHSIRAMGFNIYDDRERIRANLEMSWTQGPRLSFFDPNNTYDGNFGTFTVDANGTKLVPYKHVLFPQGEGVVSWLARKPYKVKLPIYLTDERDKVLWKAP